MLSNFSRKKMYTEENCQDSTNIDNIEFVSKLSYDEGNSLVFLGFHEIYGLCVVKDHLFSSDKIPFHINNEITTQNELKKQNKALEEKYLNEGYPTIWLLDSEGNKLSQEDLGEFKANAEDYVKHLKELLAKTKAAK